MSDARCWQVVINRQPKKMLRQLSGELRERIDESIRRLASEPRPHGCAKLAGYDDLYRIRVGDWRIVYALEEDRLIVLVLRIEPRGRAYRGL